MNRTALAVLGTIGMLSIFLPAIAVGSGLLYVDDSGNVGIGNISPMSRLDVSGAIYSRLVTDVASSSVMIDWNAGNVHSLDLKSWNTALTFVDEHPGGEYKLILNQDELGFRGVTWPDSVQWQGGAAPKLSTAASSTDRFDFLYDGTHYLGSYTLGYQFPEIQRGWTILPTRSAESSPTPPASSAPPDSPAPSSHDPVFSGLVSYWKLDESGGDAADATGSGYTLTSTGTVPFGSSYGIISNGASFDGTSQYFGTTAAGLAQSGSLSVSLWANFQGTGGQPYLVERINSGSSGRPGNFFVTYDGENLVAGFIDSAYAGHDIFYPFTPTTNAWYHIAYVIDTTGDTAYLYINGTQVATLNLSSATPNASGTQTFGIGSASADNTGFFDGYIDEVGYWSRALTSDEVSSLYNSGSGLSY